jgi:hypothetical protein
MTAARAWLVLTPLLWTQTQELTASDGTVSDEFGFSVAVSGNTAVVGAIQKTVGGNALQGAAYLFTWSGGRWTQQQELTASDGAAGDFFGFSVAISGSTVVVGAPYKTVGGSSRRGAAYVFVQSGATWSQQQELTESDGGEYDYFGLSVSVSGNTTFVGAKGKTVGANVGQGSAYVFTRSGSTWTLQQELTGNDGAANDTFGISVTVSGGTALVGACSKTIGADAARGATYVFTQSGGTWSQQQELTAPDGVANDCFGYSVALSASTAIIGALGKTVGGNTNQGAAYVFSLVGGTWVLHQELTASDGGNDYLFGQSVSLSGSALVVGAGNSTVGGSSYEGSAYVFTQSGGTWTQLEELTPSDGASWERFGTSVCMSGSAVVVGAPGKTVGTDMYRGTVYVYDVDVGDACDPSLGGQDCASGFCVDGVCCDVACGGGLATDCQACSVAAGGTSDGTCSPAVMGYLCAPATDCMQAAACNGSSDQCPPQVPVPDGTSCAGGNGTCLGGVCVGIDGGASDATFDAAVDASADAAAETDVNATDSGSASEASAVDSGSAFDAGAPERDASEEGKASEPSLLVAGCACRLAGEPGNHASNGRLLALASMATVLALARRRRRA